MPALLSALIVATLCWEVHLEHLDGAHHIGSGRDGWRVAGSTTQPGTLFPSQFDLSSPSMPRGLFPPPVVAIFSLDDDEGVAYLQVQRSEPREETGEGEETGWVEVYQDGHRLMANFSGSELSIAVGGVDTYLWASVFDGSGQWIGQSNVLHTGHHAGVTVTVDDAVVQREWLDGEPLTFDLSLQLCDGVEQQALSNLIILIDNQTVGVLRLDTALSRGGREPGVGPTKVLSYQHHGDVEVGRHTLQVAVIMDGRAFPSALSPQIWFSYRARDLAVFSFTSVFRASSFSSDPRAAVGESLAEFGGGEGCRAPEQLMKCVIEREGAVPPNRQFTEVLDGIDACIAKVCAPDATRKQAQGEGSDAAVVVRAALLGRVDAHFSAVASDFQVAENLLRAGRCLYLLGQSRQALRAWRAVHRLVGLSSAPNRAQCTYPGCNELPKDICNILSRLLHHLQSGESMAEKRLIAGGAEQQDSYSRHLSTLLPSGPQKLWRPHGGARYGLDDLVVGCLTTYSTYRGRADVVRATWWQHLRHAYFYGDVADASLPITPYASLDERWAGADAAFLREDIMRADYGSSLPKFFMALLDLFLRHPHRQWYLLVGDDNFVVPQHLLELLDGIDAAHKYIVGGPLGQHVGLGAYASGGSGLLFSNGFMQAAWRHLGPFAVSWRQGRGQHLLCHPCADVAFGFFARDVGAVTVEVECMHGMWPEYFAMHTSRDLPSCAAVPNRPRIKCARPATFHYVQPRAMRLLSRHFFPPQR